MINNPLISIIVPVYNTAPYLDKCVTSIIYQTYRNLEIILVDDGSTDDSPQKCDYYASTDFRVKVIHKKNGGVSSARNAGLDACTGEYINFVDSDDWIEPEMIQSLYKACFQNGVLLSVCGRYVHFKKNGLSQIDKCPIANKIIDSRSFVAQMLIGNNYDCSACDKLYHKSLWENIQFPEGRIYEDVAIMYKVVLSSSHVATQSKPLYNYFRHADSITTSEFNSKWFDYPNNTRELLNDIESNYPEIIEYACWTHMKAISNVLHKVYSSKFGIYRKYRCETKAISLEISAYKYIWSNSSVFSSRDRQLCELFSKWYIAIPMSQLMKAIKRIRKSFK